VIVILMKTTHLSRIRIVVDSVVTFGQGIRNSLAISLELHRHVTVIAMQIKQR